MHIPDSFLNDTVTTSLIASAAAVTGMSVLFLRKEFLKKIKFLRLATNIPGIIDHPAIWSLSEKGKDKIHKMALIGALVFALQMMNFSVLDGTSGHLLGGVLAAVVLGPWAAFITLAGVLVVQAFMFGDGGIWALGANIFNMGFVAAIGGYFLCSFLYQKFSHTYKLYTAVFITALLSVVVAASCASVEIALSGTKEFLIVFPSMISVHFFYWNRRRNYYDCGISCIV